MHKIYFLLTKSTEALSSIENISPVVDWSSTAAWLTILITLAISIITPAVTTYLTNQFQLKLKKEERSQKEQDFLYDKKFSIYEGFLQSVGKAMHYESSENIADTGKYMYELYLYLPEEHWHHLDTLIKDIDDGNISCAQFELIEISKLLSNELNSKQKAVDKQTPS